MLIGRTGRAEKQDVAAWSAARQATGFWANFGWALAYALRTSVGNEYRIGRGRGFDHRQSRLDERYWRRRLGKSRSLPYTLAMASGLFSTAFLAVDGSFISLAGMPGPPAHCGFSTSRAAITSLGPRGQKPAFAIFKQASATARMPTARAGRLTGRQRAGTLKWAHGRVSSRAVRRRGGGTSRRHFAPTAWTPLVQTPAADTCQLTCSMSHMRQDARACRKGRPMPRSTDRGMAQLALR